MHPVTHSNVLIHAVFSTRGQRPLITPATEPFLYDRISKTLFDRCYSPALAIGGGPEHVHMLFAMSLTMTIDAIVDQFRNESAGFMAKRIEGFAWQESYAAVTTSRSRDEIDKDYIRRQKQIHLNISYQDEFRQFLDRHHIEYDENEIWE